MGNTPSLTFVSQSDSAALNSDRKPFKEHDVSQSGLLDWVERTPPTIPSERADHETVYVTLDGTIFMFGGLNDSGSFADIWKWDGNNWVQVNPPLTPSDRFDFAMAYDSQREKVVLFGGCTHQCIDASDIHSDTWEFDGTSWIERTDLMPSPSARYQHNMVYDSDRGIIVLFGGDDMNSFLDDTWEYDGSGWIEISTNSAPSPRVDVGMAYHQGEQRVVLFGGCTSANCNVVPSQETWEYYNSDWHEISLTVEPSPRFYATMEYVAPCDAIVLHGGYEAEGTTSTFYDDSWFYDNLTWTKIDTGIKPSGRWGTSSAYDNQRQAFILFGGYTDDVDDDFDNDLWELQLTPEICASILPTAIGKTAMSSKGGSVLFPMIHSFAFLLALLSLFSFYQNSRLQTLLSRCAQRLIRGA